MPVRLITTRRFVDPRGWFTESWSESRFAAAGIAAHFCQDNHSLSRTQGTLRGVHFQRAPHAQAKLVRCIRGRVFDVAVDLRRASPTYGKWVAAELTAQVGEQLFVPAGFGHGFLTLEPDCEIAYKVDTPYSAASDAGIVWDDPALAVAWPLAGIAPVLSEKDQALPILSAADCDFPYDDRPLTRLTQEIL